MWCSVKYTPGHTCVKSQLYQILVEKADDSMQEGDVFADCAETLADIKEDIRKRTSSLSFPYMPYLVLETLRQ